MKKNLSSLDALYLKVTKWGILRGGGGHYNRLCECTIHLRFTKYPNTFFPSMLQRIFIWLISVGTD